MVLDTPRVTVTVGQKRREALQLAYPVCVASNARSGTIDLQLTGATFTGGGATRSGLLQDTACTVDADDSVSFLESTVYTTSEQFRVEAALVGTSARGSHDEAVLSSVGVLALELDAGTSVLPVGPDVLEVTVMALIDSVPAADVPVRFESLPTTQLLPVSLVTDAAGRATTRVLVPKDVPAMRVDAIAGDVRAGLTIRR